MRTRKSNLITISVWFAPGINSLDDVKSEADILNIAMEIEHKKKCFSIIKESEIRSLKFSEADSKMQRNKFYLQQSLAFLIKHHLATLKVVPTKKVSIPVIDSKNKNFRTEAAIYSEEEIRRLTVFSYPPFLTKETAELIAAEKKTQGDGLVCEKMTPAELDLKLKAVKSKFNKVKSPTNHFFITPRSKTEIRLDDFKFLNSEHFLLIKNNDLSEYEVVCPRTSETLVFAIPEKSTPYLAELQPPSLRIPLYHIDIQSSPEIEGEITVVSLLNSLVGKLDGTRRYEHRHCETVYGRKENNYSVKDLLLAIIEARLKEINLSNDEIDSWDDELVDLTDENFLRQFKAPPVRATCALL